MLIQIQIQTQTQIQLKIKNIDQLWNILLIRYFTSPNKGLFALLPCSSDFNIKDQYMLDNDFGLWRKRQTFIGCEKVYRCEAEKVWVKQELSHKFNLWYFSSREASRVKCDWKVKENIISPSVRHRVGCD